jgi:DnaJ-class molecular chaperone
MKGTISPSDARKYLSTLECGREADAKQLKKKWRELCKRFHPDKHSASAREKYLKELEESKKNGVPFTGEHILSQEEAEAKFKEIMHAYLMLTDPSYAFKQEMKNSTEDLDIIIPISVSFLEGFFGRKITLNLCPYEIDEKGEYVEPEKGEKVKAERLIISIPPGSSGKMKREFENRGHRRGEVRGKIMILIDIQQDNRFRYHPQIEKDIMVTEHFALKNMLEGVKEKVVTPWGIRTLRVPPASFPGTTLIIKNAGVKQLGNLHVTLSNPIFPPKEEVKSGNWDTLNFKWGIENEEDDDDDFENNMKIEFTRLLGELT